MLLPIMDEHYMTSLRKISSAKKRRSGRTPRKTSVATAKTSGDPSPVVTHQSINDSRKKTQTTVSISTARHGRTAINQDFDRDKILLSQSAEESNDFWALDSSDTDIFLANLDIASAEREHFSQEAALVPNVLTNSCSATNKSQLVNEMCDILSDSEPLDNSSDIFDVQSCGKAGIIENQMCDVKTNTGQNCSVNPSLIHRRCVGNEQSVCRSHDLNTTGAQLEKPMLLHKPDTSGRESKSADLFETDIWDGCDIKKNSPHSKELEAPDCVDFDKISHSNGTSTPKSNVTTNNKQTISTRSMSAGICGRLKRALQQNARCSTPQNTRAQRLREDRVALALTESKTCDWMGPFYGLPTQVQQLFDTQRGITKLYAWQEECLSLAGVRERRNLIYSLPTSGGKTLVAEILMLRELLCHHRDVLFVLPFVSIVQEKVRGLSEFGLALDFLVEEYAGAKGQMPPRRRKKNCVYVATLEKANSLINSLIEDGRLDSVGLVVVDELHMLGEGASRGAVLEMSLVKVMHASAATQVIGMSATLANLSDLQAFLHADIYCNDFRPVTLQEYVKIEDNIYQVVPGLGRIEDRMLHSRVCIFKYDRAKARLDPDRVAALVLEVAPRYSCLVFCATKKNCENVAQLICQFMPSDKKNVKQRERHLLLKALKHAGNGHLCPVLRNTVLCGVAYHHGGLTSDERKLLEEAYSSATLCVLTCTSTLAAGVNLPAKRVILRSPYVGMSFMSRSQYKQMTGRAGRAGIDSSGESILISQTRDKQQLLELLGGPVERCVSSLLYDGGKGLRRLLLTSIGLKLTTSVESVRTFLQRTLCHVQSKQLDVDLVSLTSTELQTLLDIGLVKLTGDKLEVTTLGRATFKGSLDVDRANQLYTDLRTAQQSLVVSNYLHLLYVVTPYDLGSQIKPSWMTYFNQVEDQSDKEQVLSSVLRAHVQCSKTAILVEDPDNKQAKMNNLDETELKVAALVGVSEGYIAKKASGQRSRKHMDEGTVERFYVTLILYSLWRQLSVWEVAAKFQLPRGLIQQLLTSAASFASCVMHFSQELDEFWALQDLLPNFVKRLSYCVTMELIPLVEIPAVTIGRARQLIRAGYKNLQQVAFAESSTLVKTVEFLSHKAAKQIVASAKLLLMEKVESLRDEADIMTIIPDMPTETVTTAIRPDTMATGPESSHASSLTLSRPKTSTRS